MYQSSRHASEEGKRREHTLCVETGAEAVPAAQRNALAEAVEKAFELATRATCVVDEYFAYVRKNS